MNQMQQMMIQAQKMQREMQKAFDEIDKKEYKVTKAGLVTITVLGNRQVQSINIEPDGFDPDNKEMIEDLIISGLNELFEKIDKEKKGYISTSDFADIIQSTRLTSGLPPLNNLELGKIMKSLDPQGTSKISFEMWFKFLRMGKRAADTAKKQLKEKQNNP